MWTKHKGEWFLDTQKLPTGLLCPLLSSVFLWNSCLPLYLFTPSPPIFFLTEQNSLCVFTWSLDLHDVLVQVLTLLHHFISHVVHGCLPLCVSFQPLLCQADVLCAARGGTASPTAAATATAWAAGIAQLTRQILIPGVQLRCDLQEQKICGMRRQLT